MPYNPSSPPTNAIGPRCAPRHQWAMPHAGDTGIRCERCARFVPFFTISDFAANSIIKARKRHAFDGAEFIKNYREAYRYNAERMVAA